VSRNENIAKENKIKTVKDILPIFTNSWNSVTMNPRVYPFDDTQCKFQIPIYHAEKENAVPLQ
jgi:hypothetical protein